MNIVSCSKGNHCFAVVSWHSCVILGAVTIFSIVFDLISGYLQYNHSGVRGEGLISHDKN